MKKDKWFWIKFIAAIFGASYASIKDLILWLKEVKPMNLEQTIDLYAFKIIVILSICYGIFVIGKFLYNLYNELQSLKEWIGHSETALNKSINKKEHNLISLIINEIDYQIKDLKEQINKIQEIINAGKQ